MSEGKGVLLRQGEWEALMHLSGRERFTSCSFGPGWVRLRPIECNLWALEWLVEHRIKVEKAKQNLKEGAFLP